MLRYASSILLLALLALSGCATNPVSGKKEAVLMSEQKEIEIGRELNPEVRKRYGVYDNHALQDYVQGVGQKLAGLSHRPGLIYRFSVLDSNEVNAFALPGGYIYITRGLLAYLNSEAELAAVLGHEIGHVTARHAVRQYTTAMAANIGYTIGSIFVPQIGNQGVGNLFNVLGTALVRGYGRQHELESDRLGAQYLAHAGYDPQAMLQVLEVLKWNAPSSRAVSRVSTTACSPPILAMISGCRRL
jgi:predicted Zn-dependent protease